MRVVLKSRRSGIDLRQIALAVFIGSTKEGRRIFKAKAGTLTRHTPSRHTQPSHSLQKSKKPR